jgi:hypothetical protein
MSFDTGFNINDLVREENKEEHSQEWRNDPNRIKAFIKKSAAAQGIVLKNPEPNCKRCHGRGWIGVDAKTGIPVVCKCIFRRIGCSSLNGLGCIMIPAVMVWNALNTSVITFVNRFSKEFPRTVTATISVEQVHSVSRRTSNPHFKVTDV